MVAVPAGAKPEPPSQAAATQSAPQEILNLAISYIRLDGNTQHRAAFNSAVVAEYACLMQSGIEFPPVRVWWDGASYWLTDGFQRIAAARSVGLETITAEVYHGTLAAAQWDSYAANAVHGIRRTAEETRRVVRLVLRHPNSARRSNAEIARHLHIPEATLRRWRKVLSSPGDEDAIRIVTRGNSTYTINTARIGRRGPTPKSRRELHAELAVMKQQSSPQVRRLLNIVGNWALGRATPAASLEALERVAEEWSSLGSPHEPATAESKS